MARSLSRRTALAGVGAGTLSVLATLGAPIPASAQATPEPSLSPLSVTPDDPAIELVPQRASEMGPYRWYEARPASWRATVDEAEGLQLVLILPDVDGLTAHIEDVTRRIAKAGYFGLGIDVDSLKADRAGNATPSASRSPDAHVQALGTVLGSWRSGPPIEDRFAVIGFGRGAELAWKLAAQTPLLNAIVPYYSAPPSLEAVPAITAAVLGVYPDEPDEAAHPERDVHEAVLTDAGVEHKLTVYPGTAHGFYDDTGPRYHETQAVAAWTDTLSWLKEYFGPGSPFV